MRRFLVVVTLALFARSADATESYGYTETLVGWSEDGNTYAVIRGAGPEGPATLEVRAFVAGKPDRVVFSASQGSKGVPEDTEDKAGVERIDVSTWAPIKQHNLKLIDAASRNRFKTTYELGTVGKRIDRYHCKNFGWTLKKKGAAKPLVEVKATKDHCFNMLGGYVHKGGKRALIKLTEQSWTSGGEEGASSSDDTTKFVLVALQ